MKVRLLNVSRYETFRDAVKLVNSVFRSQFLLFFLSPDSTSHTCRPVNGDAKIILFNLIIIQDLNLKCFTVQLSPADYTFCCTQDSAEPSAA